MNADTPNVIALSIMFFILNFLAATQDIIVDGWAITMLKRFVLKIFFLIFVCLKKINRIKFKVFV